MCRDIFPTKEKRRRGLLLEALLDLLDDGVAEVDGLLADLAAEKLDDLAVGLLQLDAAVEAERGDRGGDQRPRRGGQAEDRADDADVQRDVQNGVLAALAEHGDEGYNTNEPRPAHDADADRAGKKAAANAADDEPWFYTKRYAYPKLNSREWDLLHYTMRTETGMPGQYLDKETKWLFADKKGTQVFALYGVGDGTDPTPLYAVGGKKAIAIYEKYQGYLRGEANEPDEDRTTFSRILKNIDRQ